MKNSLMESVRTSECRPDSEQEDVTLVLALMKGE